MAKNNLDAMSMIPIVDLTEHNKASAAFASDPLVKRRAEVEQAFLDDLTSLTRKYGLEIKADIYTAYGDTYANHVLEIPYGGTEARYVVGSSGISFDSVTKESILPCTNAARATFESAKKARDEEEAVMRKYGNRISDLYHQATEKGMFEMLERNLVEWGVKKPTEFHCSCGDKFRTEAKLKRHAKETGHRA